MDWSIVDVGREGANFLSAIGPSFAVNHSSLASLVSSLTSSRPPGFVAIPELERGGISLTPVQQTSIRQYVTAGGRFVVANIGGWRESSLLNTLFGWSLGSVSCSSTSKVSHAFGFADSAASLSGLNAIRCSSVTSLPADATTIYASGSAASVWVASHGSGHVIGLGPDFYESNADWDDVVKRCTATTQERNIAKSVCMECQAGSYSNSSATAECSPCAAGKFINSSAATACLKCPANTDSSPGSTDCGCIRGFSGPDGGPCTLCSSGTYKDVDGDSLCLACPAICPANSPLGSTNITTCGCSSAQMIEVPVEVEKIVYVNKTVTVEVIKVVEVPVPWEIHRMSQLNASWGNPAYKHCELNYTLKELRQRQKEGSFPRFKTGGLGPLSQPGVFEIWVCIEDHDCSGNIPPQDGWFCWVIDERIALPSEQAPGQWVAWGHNCDLHLAR